MNINDLRHIAASDATEKAGRDAVKVIKTKQFSRDELMEAKVMLRNQENDTKNLIVKVDQLLSQLDKE